MKTSASDQPKRNEGGTMSVHYDESPNITTDEVSLNQSASAGEFAASLSNTSPYFDEWLKSIQPGLASHDDPGSGSETPPSAEPVPGPPSIPGEFRFEGTLRVDCYITGLVRSQKGTLIVTETGEVDTNLSVPVAIIDGVVRGDIKATERVEMRSSAKVIGNIETPSLRIEPGAVFEGRCHFVQSSQKPLMTDPYSLAEPSRLSVIRPRGIRTVPDAAETEVLVAAAGR